MADDFDAAYAELEAAIDAAPETPDAVRQAFRRYAIARISCGASGNAGLRAKIQELQAALIERAQQDDVAKASTKTL